MTEIHFLNACILMPSMILVGIVALYQYRKGETITPPLRAAMILVQLALALQIFLGVNLLHDRRRNSLIHYSFGLLPILFFFAISWLSPQLRARRTLALGISWLAAGVSVILAFVIAFVTGR
jgi:hypothetical protein